MDQERRKHKRTEWNKPGTVTALTGNHIINCAVRDISVGGALLLAPVSEVVPDYFRLNYGSAMEPKCSVRWRKGNELGVAFMLREKRGGAAA